MNKFTIAANQFILCETYPIFLQINFVLTVVIRTYIIHTRFDKIYTCGCYCKAVCSGVEC